MPDRRITTTRNWLEYTVLIPNEGTWCRENVER